MNIIADKVIAVNRLLEDIIKEIDLTPNQRKEAVKRYEAVGKFLCAEGTLLAHLKPEVYPQGSFQLGTVTKPPGKEDQFDIDLVCLLQVDPKRFSQRDVKKLLEKRLRESKDYDRMLDDEHRRCWRLIYAEATKFHMDLLPARPDEAIRLLVAGVEEKYRREPIAITDNELPNYGFISEFWPRSNPRGYVEWFKDQMREELIFAKRQFALASAVQMSVDEVADYRVKTSLQRAIQIMKRHRDLCYPNDEDRPISIIITTLAATAFPQSLASRNDLMQVLLSLLKRMKNLVEYRKAVDEWWVQNPVDPHENFADKWKYYPRKKELYFEWLDRAESDFMCLLEKRGHDLHTGLMAMLGDSVVKKVLTQRAQRMSAARGAGALFMDPKTGRINELAGQKIQPHSFFGKG